MPGSVSGAPRVRAPHQEGKTVEKRVHLGKASDVGENDVEAFPAGERLIAVARVGDQFYAIDDRCTHKECSLSEGVLDERTLTCPCHGSEFDLTTGEPLALPATKPVERFEIIVDGEELYVTL